jgi:hypothetical protein
MSTEKQIPALAGMLVMNQEFLGSLSTKDAQWLFKNPREGIKIICAAIRSRSGRLLPCPAVGEIFDLEIDGNAPEVDPLNMVLFNADVSCTTGRGWRFEGKSVKGKQTSRFMLVEPDDHSCRLPQLKKTLRERGRIPEGQWLVAFMEKYQAPICRFEEGYCIAIADDSWIDIGARRRLPYLGEAILELDFEYAEVVDIRENWLWLVEVK